MHSQPLDVDERTRSDIDNIRHWQKTRDPGLLGEITMRYQPVVNSVVNKYKTAGVNPDTLKSKANAQLLLAIHSYDPGKGTAPTTHIWNHLQKVQRVAGESLQSGHIPENRAIKMSVFKTTRDNLSDRLGYEPNTEQMAEEMGWSQAEVQRMNTEMAGEVTASNAEFDFFGNSKNFSSRDKDLVDYLYHELEPREKVIFEHTFGYGGKPILKNKELAHKLGTNEMAIHRAKKRMSERIREYQ